MKNAGQANARDVALKPEEATLSRSAFGGQIRPAKPFSGPIHLSGVHPWLNSSSIEPMRRAIPQLNRLRNNAKNAGLAWLA